MFAVVHCPNFYIQCEQLFNPSLNDKAVAVVVNDGVDSQKVVASSINAQKLGVKPGLNSQELADARDALSTNTDLKLCSPNYELYADVSERFIKSVELLTPSTSVYSYDEVYIDLEDTSGSFLALNQSLREYAQNIQQSIKQWLGISTVIGLAPTLTLAKLACNAAFRFEEYNGVIAIEHVDESHTILERISINEIDGISKKEASKLSEINVRNALELCLAPKHQVRRRCSVIVERIALELAGLPCNGVRIDVNAQNQGIILDRQTAVNTLTDAKRSLSKQLKAVTQSLGASALYKSVTITLATSSLSPTHPLRRSQLTSGSLPNASNSIAKIEKLISQLIDSLWDERQKYHSLAVELEHLSSATENQHTLFLDNRTLFLGNSVMDPSDSRTTTSCFEVLLGPEDLTNTLVRRSLKSPSYTTKWADILRVG